LELRAGFDPATITLPRPENIDLNEFKKWLIAKEYSKSYIIATMSYSNRYNYILINNRIRDLDTLSGDKKGSAIKALILLSKFLGTTTQFKAKLEEYGIKIPRPNSLTSFLRIFNNRNSDILKWYGKAIDSFRDNEALFTKFLLHSGLRTTEAINSFNLIIKLGRESRLPEYYDADLKVLTHFKYPKLFIRRTKNCYITFIQPEFLKEIAESKPVTYAMMRKRIERKHLKTRFNELRDKFGTYLLNHGILEAEINLCQGRMPVDIFIRHYWSPKLKELGNRIFRTLENIENIDGT
jgi:intergrase/recombinase